MVNTTPQPGGTGPLAQLAQVSLAEVEQRLADLDAERAALALLRRSLAARERARRRSAKPRPGEGQNGV